MWSRHLFFMQKKKRKTKYKNSGLNCFLSLIKKIHVWKIENYMALGPSYKLPNKYMSFCPSYNLPKIKAKIRYRSTYPKKLNSEARLRNGKVLSTHSTQTESGFLNSYDQCTLFLCMRWMVYCTCEINYITKIYLWTYLLLC